MKTVQAGRLRRLMRFERITSTLDSDGAHVEAWVPAWPVNERMPVEIVPASGRQYIEAEAFQSKVTHRVKVRFRDGIDARTVRGIDEFGVVYNIEAVLPDPDSGRRYLSLMCSTGVSVSGL